MNFTQGHHLEAPSKSEWTASHHLERTLSFSLCHNDAVISWPRTTPLVLGFPSGNRSHQELCLDKHLPYIGTLPYSNRCGHEQTKRGKVLL